MTFFRRVLLGSAFLTVMFITACSRSSQTDLPPVPEFLGHDDVKLNQIQVLGTHNSYAQGLDWLLAQGMGRHGEAFEGLATGLSEQQVLDLKDVHPNPGTMADWLNYRHAPLQAQLDGGMRTIELDIYIDPEGGRFLKPATRELIKDKGIPEFLLSPHDITGLHEPGFKVLHVADVDYRSHCNLFTACLADLKTWSQKNPNHSPIFLFLETKDKSFGIENGVELLPFDRHYFDAMDRRIIDVLGRENLIMPDDVRSNFSTLEQAVLANNWPTLAESRGKFIVTLITVFDQAAVNTYLEGHPSLSGRVAFLAGQPGQAHAAFLLLDNALTRFDEIQARVKQGYLVRSRTDIETYEAKINDSRRANAAFASGAQILSTDFPYRANTWGTDYQVSLPGGYAARCNPVNSSCD